MRADALRHQLPNRAQKHQWWPATAQASALRQPRLLFLEAHKELGTPDRTSSSQKPRSAPTGPWFLPKYPALGLKAGWYQEVKYTLLQPQGASSPAAAQPRRPKRRRKTSRPR